MQKSNKYAINRQKYHFFSDKKLNTQTYNTTKNSKNFKVKFCHNFSRIEGDLPLNKSFCMTRQFRVSLEEYFKLFQYRQNTWHIDDIILKTI